MKWLTGTIATPPVSLSPAKRTWRKSERDFGQLINFRLLRILLPLLVAMAILPATAGIAKAGLESADSGRKLADAGIAERVRALSSEQRLEFFLGLPDEQKQRILGRYRAWKNFESGVREILRSRFDRIEKFDPDVRTRIVSEAERLAGMPPYTRLYARVTHHRIEALLREHPEQARVFTELPPESQFSQIREMMRLMHELDYARNPWRRNFEQGEFSPDEMVFDVELSEGERRMRNRDYWHRCRSDRENEILETWELEVRGGPDESPEWRMPHRKREAYSRTCLEAMLPADAREKLAEIPEEEQMQFILENLPEDSREGRGRWDHRSRGRDRQEWDRNNQDGDRQGRDN
ncbi:MAG: DUF3106 domain-containing protein [Planctomycetes bacterium]|nr:DUF3106 domain-containing protein [Planctomycetota bacterium]